ncbi:MULTISPECIES: hypothetical protein [Streptomyces]|uniref:Uncharacterized protein n=1 Tax=Streptomyces zinciresistens K42 TaxID=700597 RepID=G2G745_9ACTN|nr:MULTISPECIES: hypothetical protein [Streptomyces]EGX60586.1 hypothetical protein SZN_06536 [Streptomyces zinciresistens K42]MDT9695944.1 hypothetical protein [Streptomyces sp. P17]
MSDAPTAHEVGTVFEPSWDDNPTWRGTRPYADLGTAQEVTAETYREDLEQFDESEPAGVLKWRHRFDGLWELTDDGHPTPVAIRARALYGPPQPLGELSAEEQLRLATEFRIPLPLGSAGGYGEVVVRPDSIRDRWAVTNGAITGLEAWVAGEGWRRVSDVGPDAVYTLTREKAIILGYQVADLEGALHQAAVAATPRTGPAAMPVEKAAEADVATVLEVAVRIFHTVTGSTDCDSDLCWDVLSRVLATVPMEEITDYPRRLEQFVVRRNERLDQVYREFGPGSPLAVHGRYELVGQPVSLPLFERLDVVPHLLLGTLQGELPEVWVADAASAWNPRLP